MTMIITMSFTMATATISIVLVTITLAFFLVTMPFAMIMSIIMTSFLASFGWLA
eukprot:CAMPEP_0169100176 /NCGR_PEP_ID=MMETSP1015-20121227/20946_1 /TAXON_ID=342587 /ORGANISM="Karlodinium micrum, Strain CCMP2283" /LENGTH=53 /DNA_ID=CAMNT_0009161097 /DNA_START=130 /DNA_END=291 /DNA_ORIENTATION=-